MVSRNLIMLMSRSSKERVFLPNLFLSQKIMGKFNLFQKQRLLTFTGQVFGRDYLSRGNKNMKDEENDKQILARLTELLISNRSAGKEN